MITGAAVGVLLTLGAMEVLEQSDNGGEPAGDSSVSAGDTSVREAPSSALIIAIDAGHGGEDAGATYPVEAQEADALVLEKDLNLVVAEELASLLGQDDRYEVVLTRETDDFIQYAERQALASEACEATFGRDCDLYVSVHHNSFVDALYDGPQVIYDEVDDAYLASTILGYLKGGLSYPPPECTRSYQFNDYGTLYETFDVLPSSGFASVLSEAYFVSNDCEAQHHLSGSYEFSICDGMGECRTVILGERVFDEAKALYEGIDAYFDDESALRIYEQASIVAQPRD